MAFHSRADKLKTHLKTLNGDVGYAACHLLTGQSLVHNNRRFLAASTIKLPMMFYYFYCWERGLDPQQPYRYQSEDWVEDSPYFDNLQLGTLVDWREILRAMMIVSDNTATNLIIDALGLNQIQAWIESLGLKQTQLQRKMVDLEARAQGIDNWTTPAEMLELMRMLVTRQDPISELNAGQSLEILYQSQDLEKIPFYFRWPVQVANKPGELPGNRSDIAYVYDGKNQVIISVFCDQLENDEAADEWIATLAQLLWQGLTVY